MKLATKPYKGTRDFFPDEMAQKNWVTEKVNKTVESFGYWNYDGPMLESFDLYAAKTGQEIVEKQLYWFEDKGGRKVAIRPEMTPTMARMVASQFSELPKPIRWYSWPNLWRYERPQRGRLREHWQLNVDVLGGDTILADAEILTLAHAILDGFGGGDKAYISINNRKLVNFVFSEALGFDAATTLQASKAIDARDKIGEEAYDKWLTDLHINAQQKITLENFFNSSFEEVLKKFPCPGSADLHELFSVLKGTPVEKILKFDPKVMRGLDYYTGTVFEVFDSSPENNRAMYGGGRYDNLIGLFGKNQISGAGFGMGDVTLRNFLETHHLLPNIKANVDVFVTQPEVHDLKTTLEIANQLRSDGFKVATPLGASKLGAQLKLADKYQARFCLILGEEELKTNSVQVKTLNTGEQKQVLIKDLSTFLLTQK